MRKIIGRITFFIILVVLLVIASQIFDRMSAAEGRRGEHSLDYIYTLFGEEKRDSLDVIVIGDSESVAGYSPLEAYLDSGVASFSASRAAMRMQEAYPLLRMAVLRQHPKAVLVEALAMTVPMEKDEARRIMAESTAKNLFPVFRFHNAWRHLINPLDWQPKMWKGYIIRKGVERPSQAERDDYMKPDSGKSDISPENVSALRRMKVFCDAHGTKLILFACPSTTNYDMTVHNAIEEIAEDSGIPFLDLNLSADEIGIDWNTDTFDKGDHLNLSGAQKMTKYLTRQVRDMVPSLPDRRADPDYADWNEEAEAYRKDADEGMEIIRETVKKQEARRERRKKKQGNNTT